MPADRAEAKKRISSTGNDRSASIRRITVPTCPVAPTTPTRTVAACSDAHAHRSGRSSAGAPVDDGLLVLGAELERVVHGADGTSRSVSRQTTEMRISDVEIISTLTPASASAVKNVADTPGCERMPAPISDSLPMWSS